MAGLIGLIVLLVGAIVISCLCHFLIRKYMKASLIAAIWSSVAFQCIIYVRLGYWDAFLLVGLVFGSVYSFAVALLVGIPFVRMRRNDRPK